jgi:hypothetical protein
VTEPLPRHYSRDEVVALATDPRSAYLYWEVRPVSFARARWRDADGSLLLRVLWVARGEGPRTRDLAIDELVGDTFVRDLDAGSEVRICIGWNGPRGFRPIAVAPPLSMPRDYGSIVEAARMVDVTAPARMRDGARALDTSTIAEVAIRRVRAHEQIATGIVVGRQSGLSRAGRSIGGQASPSAPGRGGASDLHAGYGGASDLWRRGGSSDLSAG